MFRFYFYFLTLFIFYDRLIEAYIYDFYSTHVISPDQVLRTANEPHFRDCTIRITECSPNEPRRSGDACNNLKRPSESQNRNQYSRLLPPRFGPNNTVVEFAEDGSELPLPRVIRTTLQKSARVVSSRFSMLALHYGGFFALDITKIDSIPTYLVMKTDCCTRSGENDPKCLPLYVPKDDPYLKGTGVRCMNLTRGLTFQEVGCVTNDVPSSIILILKLAGKTVAGYGFHCFAVRTIKERSDHLVLAAWNINFATPHLDLNPIYGPNITVTDRIRSFSGGQLRMEFRKNRYVPPGKSPACLANKRGEPCYEFGDTSVNFQAKLTAIGIWFVRNHNAIASELSLINPCWDDEHLYQTARDINIAIHQKIVFYELLPLFLGKKNMLKNHLISEQDDYVNAYDPHLDSRTPAEIAVGFRILHSLLDDSFGLYDKDANLVGVTALNFYLFGIGSIENDDNMETMSRSQFYQPAGDSRHHADTALSNNMYSKFHKANDLFAIDIMRGRDFGLRSYNMYREFCGLPKAHKFEDLIDTIDKEFITKLKKLYHSVDAIELTAGIIAERDLPDAAVGSVYWCLMGYWAKRLRNTDRFWFENGKVKAKLTLPQLKAIKRHSMSRVACDTNDELYKIQPDAFSVVSKENPLLSCEAYPKLDLTLWKDDFCNLAPRGRIN